MDLLRDKVVCTLCNEPYKDTPKVLPGCLHIFCLSCLHKLPISYVIQSSPERESGEKVVECEASSSKLDFKDSYFGDSLCSSGRSRASSVTCSSRDTSYFSCSPTPLQPPANLARSVSVQEPRETRRRHDSGSLLFSVSCPKCNRCSPLPPSGVDSLQTDYLALSLVGTYTAVKALQSKLSESTCDQCVEDTPAVSFCTNCMKMICEDHAKCHNLWEEFSAHRVFPLSSLAYSEDRVKRRDSAIIRYLRPSLCLGEFRCPRHLKETSDHHIKYFCTLCADLVCGNCTISSHKSSEDHNCDFITREHLSEKKKLTEESLDQLSNLFQDLDVLSGSIHNQCEGITKDGEEAKSKIEELFSEVISFLETRKKMLCDEIDDIINGPLGHLSDCNKKVNTIKDHVRECQNFVRGNLDCEGDLPLLTVADVISSHTKTMESEYKELLPEAEVTVPDIAVSCNKRDQLSDIISKFAGVHLLSENANLRSRHEKRSLLQPLMLKERIGDSSSGSKSKILSQSMSSIAEVFSRNLQDSVTGGYVYSPPQLSPSGYNQQSDNLSSPIMINLPKIAGIYIRTIESVSKPSGIRIDQRNSNLVVSVFGSHQVTTLDQNGTEIQSIGREGDRSGHFLFPQNSARDSQGKTLVVDSLYRIQVFDRNGKFLKSIGQKGKGQLQFNDPVAIAIGPNKKIYVLERHNQRIQILNSNFTFHSFIGKAGRGECEFYLPSDLTICECGHLYVADSGNHRVQVLTLEGSFLCTFGSKGSGPGELCHPSHLCVGSDEICVTEEGNHRVSIFSLKGCFIQSFGCKGTGEKDFNRPLGIAIDHNKILYVCDSKNNRIQIFK